MDKSGEEALQGDLLEVVQDLEKGKDRVELVCAPAGYRLLGYRLKDSRGTFRLDLWKVDSSRKEV